MDLSEKIIKNIYLGIPMNQATGKINNIIKY